MGRTYRGLSKKQKKKIKEGRNKRVEKRTNEIRSIDRERNSKRVKQ